MDGEQKQLIDNIRIALSDKKNENDILKAAVELMRQLDFDDLD